MTDRLGVRSSCEAVVQCSDHVRIDDSRVQALAAGLLVSDEVPAWDADLHFRATGPDGGEQTAMWLLVLDAINFCFWGQGEDPNQRWRVQWRGELVDGYTALVAALTAAVEHGYPLLEPRWLASVTKDDVAAILAPAEGHTSIPLFDYRVSNLREVGAGLIPYDPEPVTAFIESADHDAISLVQRIVATFPSFNDATSWPYADTGLLGNEVRFYKRAQILVGDLAGGMQGSPLAAFTNLDQLTAFADYKVPQMLRWLGALVYDAELARLVDNRMRIPASSRMEIEIRAATIVACDRIVAAMRESGRQIIAAELDWLLWTRSQGLSFGDSPYHLTETIFY